jgi:hypothetical protein
LLAEIDALGWPSQHPPDHDVPHCGGQSPGRDAERIGKF